MSFSGFLKQVGSAVETAAKDVEKDLDKAAHSSPMDAIKPGNILMFRSKVNQKLLRVLEGGVLDCSGDGGSSCEFIVEASGYQGTFKFRNAMQSTSYLAIVNIQGQLYCVGNGGGGPECDFLPVIQLDSYIAFQSGPAPMAHIGTLPSGQMTAPAQTPVNNDTAHFKVQYMRKVPQGSPQQPRY